MHVVLTDSGDVSREPSLTGCECDMTPCEGHSEVETKGAPGAGVRAWPPWGAGVLQERVGLQICPPEAQVKPAVPSRRLTGSKSVARVQGGAPGRVLPN